MEFICFHVLQTSNWIAPSRDGELFVNKQLPHTDQIFNNKTTTLQSRGIETQNPLHKTWSGLETYFSDIAWQTPSLKTD